MKLVPTVSLYFHDIQLLCIINAPNSQRLNGCIRQCLTTGQHTALQWKSSAAKLFLALPSAESQKGVSAVNGFSKINHVSKLKNTYSEPLSGAEASSSSIAPRSMHHIGDPTSSVALLPSRNYLDSYRTSSAATTTMQPTTMMTMPTTMGKMGGTMTMDSAAITATAATSGATMTAVQSNQPQLPTAAAKGNQPHQQQQLLSGGVKSQLHQQNEPVAAGGSHNPNEEQSPMSMSYVLRTQLDELKRLPQPLGSNLLSNNELDVCKKHNITPTTYLSLKTVCLSGAPSLGSPMEISLRKFFIKCGWLSH